MALQTTIENLDDVQDEFHALYSQTDDGFVLQVEGIDVHPDVVNLKNSYVAEKAKRKTQGKELEAAKKRFTDAEKLVEEIPEDFSLDAWNAAKDGKTDDAALSSLRDKMADLRKKFEADILTLKGENDSLKEAGKRMVIERGLDDLIVQSGVTIPAFQRAVRREMLGRISVDDAGKSFVDSDELGPMPVPDYLKRFLANEGKDFVSPPKGGGAQGNDRGAGGAGKTLTRAEFEALNTVQRAKAMKEGIKLTN